MPKIELIEIPIKNPYNKNYGNKLNFKLSDVAKIISVGFRVYNYDDLILYRFMTVGLANSILSFYKFSLLLNNGNDECVSNVYGGKNIYEKVNLINMKDFRNGLDYFIPINKPVINNAVHTVITKMPQSQIDDSLRGSSFMQNYEFYRDNAEFRLILKVEKI